MMTRITITSGRINLLLLAWWLLLLILATPAVIVAFAPHPILRARSSIGRAPALTLNANRNIVILSHNVTQDVADGYFDVNTLLTGRVDVLARCVNSGLWISNGIRKDTNVFLMLFPHNITIEVRGEEVTGLNPDERTMALCLQRTLLAGDDGSNNNNESPALSLDDDGDGDGCSPASAAMAMAATQERRQLELERLQKRELKRPETFNPHKPGSLSKSEKKSLRTVRKAREAMIRRIKRSTTGEGSGSAPDGFILHRDDSLEERLRLLELEGNNTATCTSCTLMMDELGEPLVNVLGGRSDNNKHDDKTTTTTIILGDQMGYMPCDEQMLADDDAVTKVSLGPLSLLTSQCITITHNCLDMQEVS